MRKRFITILLFVVFISCNQKKEPIALSTKDYHNVIDKVTNIMVHDIFSPPVASRIYVYPNIAAYEIIAQTNDKYKSLENQVKGLTAIPKVKEKYPVNYQLAALIAHLDVSKKLIFSEFF